MAERLVFAPFAKGDVMTRQGAVAHWLYILIEGDAEVVVDQPSGERRVVSRLAAGTCFGEMGLLTGEPPPRHGHRHDRRGVLSARQGLARGHPALAAGARRVFLTHCCSRGRPILPQKLKQAMPSNSRARPRLSTRRYWRASAVSSDWTKRNAVPSRRTNRAAAGRHTRRRRSVATGRTGQASPPPATSKQYRTAPGCTAIPPAAKRVCRCNRDSRARLCDSSSRNISMTCLRRENAVIRAPRTGALRAAARAVSGSTSSARSSVHRVLRTPDTVRIARAQDSPACACASFPRGPVA